MTNFRLSITGCRVALAAIAGLLCSQSGAQERHDAAALVPQVRVDQRVELFSLIFRLAGNPEYNQAKVDAYAAAADEHFGPLRDHEVVQLARRLRAERGISFDAVMSLAIHVRDARSLEERVPLEPSPETLDGRWQPEEARQFLAAAKRFVADSSFQDFTREHAELYGIAEERMTEMLSREAHFEWFDHFFGTPPNGSFTVVVGLLNGGNNFGCRVSRTDGSEDRYGIIGVWKTDRQKDPVFDKSVLSIVVHEFCHSYANPLVDQCADQLQRSGEAIFPFVEQAMARQAYTTWRTMMYESLVRASTIRYLARHEGRLAAGSQILSDQRIQFRWIADLAALLATYETDRERYPQLADFMPQIIDFFDRYAESFAREQAELEKKLPKVVSITPAAGDPQVDPRSTILRIEFDRAMRDNSWSLVGGGEHFPEIDGKPKYDRAGKVWTVPIKLQPNWNYQFGLNSERLSGFQSADGVPLRPLQVSFRTAGE